MLLLRYFVEVMRSPANTVSLQMHCSLTVNDPLEAGVLFSWWHEGILMRSLWNQKHAELCVHCDQCCVIQICTEMGLKCNWGKGHFWQYILSHCWVSWHLSEFRLQVVQDTFIDQQPAKHHQGSELGLSALYGTEVGCKSILLLTLLLWQSNWQDRQGMLRRVALAVATGAVRQWRELLGLSSCSLVLCIQSRPQLRGLHHPNSHQPFLLSHRLTVSPRWL